MKKILNIIQISLKNHTVYFYDILGSYISMTIRILILTFLYKAIYSTSLSGIINGFRIEEITWAVIFAQVVVFSRSNITEEVSDEIKSGRISVFLLNPISYIWFKFLQNFTGILYSSFSFLILGIFIGYLMLGGIETSIPGIFGGIILLFGALIISFFGYFMVGLIAFVSEDTSGFRFIYSKIDMLFGGNLLPIAFMPPIMQTIAFILPFVYTGYTAGLIFVNFSLILFLKYLLIQIIWIIIFILLSFTIFNYGRKKLTINGG